MHHNTPSERIIIDRSPENPDAKSRLANAARLVLIDNFDSFTWNIYQYLELEGAHVTVYRNDEITLAELIEFNPSQLVVSPGPGNPDDDAGISREAIRHFAGKIPVLGVCMGEQCMYTVFGGKVETTGEILHGKTSPLTHDGRGVFRGLRQNIAVTRYHSLAGTHATLPECLEVSAWTKTGTESGRSVIQGIRHKLFVAEGVQFHPESILTEDGRLMMANFLQFKGGTWEEHRAAAMTSTRGASNSPQAETRRPSILEEIFAKRKLAVESQKLIPSQRPEDHRAELNLALAPPSICFPKRIRQSRFSLSLMAEVKRASPSKGDIALDICAPAQAKKYALAGASVISVLTEPEYFKGSLADLRAVRRALDPMPHRPALLRKEFIFDEYQILEARLAGADTVLLIVKMLDMALLTRLYKYSQSLGMEPLVEVNTRHEMDIAMEIGAQVIGVNNRNLANFEVDIDTTSQLMKGIPSDIIVCALSGISKSQDVELYQKNGVKGVLIGEALMRCPDVKLFVDNLLPPKKPIKAHNSPSQPPMVKICGTRTASAAKVAIEAGADMIGIILVQGRKRCVSESAAAEISQVVHQTERPNQLGDSDGALCDIDSDCDYFEWSQTIIRQTKRALLVGVFQDQPLEYIIQRQKSLALDIVQLHGNEPLEWSRHIPVPVVRRLSPTSTDVLLRGYHALPLLDSASGGTGQAIDLDQVKSTLQSDSGLKVILAGGLTPETVQNTLHALGTHVNQIVAVDVSSGVEKDGEQDSHRIRDFISAVKAP